MHIPEREGIVESLVHLFEAKIYLFLVRTRSLRQLLVFITRENALLAPLTRLFMNKLQETTIFSGCQKCYESKARKVMDTDKSS